MVFRHYLYDLDYEDPAVYAVLLSDSTRVTSYLQAIDEIVRPTDTVVELGSGPGLFGRHASKKGARVLLVEGGKKGANLAHLLNELLSPVNKIEVINQPIEAVKLPPSQVVIHELLGGRVLDEGLRSIMTTFSSNNNWITRDDVTIIPNSIEIWIKLIEIEESTPVYSWKKPNLPLSAKANKGKALRWVTSKEDFHECSNWYKLTVLDSKDITNWPKTVRLSNFNITRPGANAVLWGFVAHLSKKVKLDVRLGLSPTTTWGGTAEILKKRLLTTGKHSIHIELGATNKKMVDYDRWIQKVEISA